MDFFPGEFDDFTFDYVRNEELRVENKKKSQTPR
jgi:hypothetical protein